MTPCIVVGSLLLAFLPGDPPSPSASAKDYQAAKARAGDDPRAQVDLALWCEARGLTAERLKHLASAVLADPENVKARGLMGLVSYRGKWETPERVGEIIKGDEALAAKLAEYNRRRAELVERIEAGGRRRPLSRRAASAGHVKLGLWCETAGLKAEASAHFTSAVVLDPYSEATWKHIGYIKHNGRWMSHEQIDAERADAEAQRHADRHWEPLLRKYRDWLAEGSKARREEARTRLAAVIDPRAVRSVIRVFVDGKESDQEIAVRMLGQIDSPASSRELAELAVFSASARVRSAATQSLRPREPRDYGGMLVQMIRSPMTYRAQPVRGPGSPGGLLIDTPRYRVMRTYDAPVAVRLGGFRNGYIGYDANGLPVAASHHEEIRIERESPIKAAPELARIEARTREMIAEANLKAMVSQRRLIADVNAIETANAEAAIRNDWVIPVLTAALDAPADLKDDEDAWNKWWYDKIGYRYISPPKMTLAVNASPQLPPPVIISCFVAGTPVRTPDGHRPIESLIAGDQVLTQDAATGELSFQPVLVVHHNPPGATFRVALDNGETLVASVYHRFWLAGKGWKMARDLKAGDIVRTYSGPSRIASVTPGPVEPLFNLDVAKTRTFFVGEHDALVHDNTLPDLRVKPFDAEPAIATARHPD